MMKLGCFSVMDKIAAAYSKPFYETTKGLAIRAFSDACNDEKGPFGRHADDYVLYFLGTFDDASGKFDSVEPERLVGANEVRTKI